MAVLKLLVVDDEPGIRSGVSRILRDFKVDYPFMDEHIEFDILEEADGESALETIRAKQPEIILLDNKLPGIQGVDVLETIKKENFNSVVVMITSYASLELAVKATEDGAHDFIPKPFTPQDLRSSVETVTKHIFLKQMTKKLNTEGRQIRFQFLSVLSHELKAPINAVEGYLKMLQDKQFGDDLNNYNQVIDRTMKRIKGMHNLILDMLDLTKVETGNVKRNIKEINLLDSVNSAIDTMQPYAIQRDVAIHVNGPDYIPVEADPEELETIFNNLISNAIKYNKENGRVDVTIREQNEQISIQVADTGIGMNKTELSKLFDDFVRIKNEKTKNISGSGLGLSIVKKLINSYDGEINVCSKPNEGSIFTLTFPKAKKK